ncbi:MAG: PH domain-containing protein [Candidatus Marinimicrobia bacterium]|nr:PH domain-containing protein [Flavobacterium sp.]MBT5782920.1 PH domain-containing protein [Candidatus Neomarinimicrobiota bacterium]
MPRNRPFIFIFNIILNIVGFVSAFRFEEQALQITGLVVWIATIVFFLIWFIHTKSTKLSITNTDILLEKGLLSKERREVAIEKVRTVNIKQTFLNRILGVGEISIFTAGDLPEIVVPGMPDPNKTREIIKQKQNK